MIYLFILLIRYLAVMTYDLFIYSINQIFSSNDFNQILFIYSLNQIFSSNDL